MFRLTLLLCAAMAFALFTAGEDRGQLRPGLAKAAAEKAIEAPVAVVAAEPEPVVPAAAALPDPAPVVAEVAPEPEPYVEPEREVVQAVEEPIFTLSALPTESPPPAPVQPELVAETEAEPAADPAPDATGEIWYVSADSVNVRELPSTDSGILGKLAAGEAALILADVDGEWVRIVIQGDGMEGYVALRYLSPVAP